MLMKRIERNLLCNGVRLVSRYLAEEERVVSVCPRKGVCAARHNPQAASEHLRDEMSGASRGSMQEGAGAGELGREGGGEQSAFLGAREQACAGELKGSEEEECDASLHSNQDADPGGLRKGSVCVRAGKSVSARTRKEPSAVHLGEARKMPGECDTRAVILDWDTCGDTEADDLGAFFSLCDRCHCEPCMQEQKCAKGRSREDAVSGLLLLGSDLDFFTLREEFSDVSCSRT